MRRRAEIVWDAGALLGEGPVWDAESGRVYWVDIKQGRLHAYHPATEQKTSWVWQPPVGCVFPIGGGRVLAATGHGIVTLDLAHERPKLLRVIAHPEHAHPTNRYNDGVIGPTGDLWVGSMDDQEQAVSGSFWRLRPEGQCDRVLGGIGIANGPVFSTDGGTVYFTDSKLGTVWAAPVSKAGAWGPRSVFYQTDALTEFPDGMATDRAGGVWIAIWGGGCVRRVVANGQVDCEISVPALNVSSCTFGGADLRTLYITTASNQSDGAPASRADGALFAVIVDHVGGLPPALNASHYF